MPKSINKMTRKEMQSLLRRIYKANVARTELDQTLLNTLGNLLTPLNSEGLYARAPGPVALTEPQLSMLLWAWTDGYNKKCLPAVVSLEKAIFGSDY